MVREKPTAPQNPKRLCASEIRACLREWAEDIRIEVYEEIDSTNREAKRRALTSDRTPTLILAECQTEGRGRLGRSFFSPVGAGIYMTYLWHPNVPAADVVSVTTAASVAVMRALISLSAAPETELGIKWVNDIMLNGKKVCGILTEAVTDPSDGRVSGVLVGIGLNVSPTSFPSELSGIATCLGGNIDRNLLAAQILRELLTILRDPSPYSHMPYYREHSLVIGKDVATVCAGVTERGRVLDIDPTGGLVIRREDGAIETIHSGEVSLRM